MVTERDKDEIGVLPAATPESYLPRPPRTDSNGVDVCCNYCNDGDGYCAYPVYGRAPHTYPFPLNQPDSRLSITKHEVVPVPKEEWPDNFVEDNDSGLGTYTHCQHCGRPENQHTHRPSPTPTLDSDPSVTFRIRPQQHTDSTSTQTQAQDNPMDHSNRPPLQIVDAHGKPIEEEAVLTAAHTLARTKHERLHARLITAITCEIPLLELLTHVYTQGVIDAVGYLPNEPNQPIDVPRHQRPEPHPAGSQAVNTPTTHTTQSQVLNNREVDPSREDVSIANARTLSRELDPVAMDDWLDDDGPIGGDTGAHTE